MNMFHTLIAPGSTIAHTLSISPRSLTTRNVGTMPPENSMVNAIMELTAFLPTRSGRDSGYAVISVITTFIAVPSSVYTSVFLYPLIIISLRNTRSYAASVAPWGSSVILLCTTESGSLSEHATTYKSGYSMIMDTIHNSAAFTSPNIRSPRLMRAFLRARSSRLSTFVTTGSPPIPGG